MWERGAGKGCGVWMKERGTGREFRSGGMQEEGDAGEGGAMKNEIQEEGDAGGGGCWKKGIQE